VDTKRLNEQVKRNAKRFPDDCMFRLTRIETEDLDRSRFASGSQKHRDPRFPPYAFTAHGAIMAASILSAIRELMIPSTPNSRSIGFTADIGGRS